jgi:hypothetical protein
MAWITRVRGARAGIVFVASAMIAVGADQRPLQINVLEGEGAFNDIRKGVGRAPVVEVKDDTGRAVENARVVFQLPEMGAGATFLDGSRMFVATSDPQGRAAAPALRPNRVEGQFAIAVTASKDGSVGHAEVRESNTLAGGAQAGGGHGKAKILIAIAGAAGGIAVAAARSGGKSGGSTGAAVTPPTAALAPVPTTLSAGTITIGGPR